MSVSLSFFRFGSSYLKSKEKTIKSIEIEKVEGKQHEILDFQSNGFLIFIYTFENKTAFKAKCHNIMGQNDCIVQVIRQLRSEVLSSVFGYIWKQLDRCPIIVADDDENTN